MRLLCFFAAHAMPTRLTSGPRVAPKPLDVGAEPLDIAAEPLDIAAELLDIRPKPLVVSANPLDIAPEPLDITLEPLDVGVEPLDVVAKPDRFGFVVPPNGGESAYQASYFAATQLPPAVLSTL